MTGRVMWAISKGDYSDYRVLALLDTKKEAAALVKRYNAAGDWQSAYIESFEVISADVQRVEILFMSVVVRDDGSVSDVHSHTSVEWPFDALFGAAPVYWRWVRAPIYQGAAGRLDVHGTDHERVRKVFGDRLAMLRTDPAYRSRDTLTSDSRVIDA